MVSCTNCLENGATPFEEGLSCTLWRRTVVELCWSERQLRLLSRIETDSRRSKRMAGGVWLGRSEAVQRFIYRLGYRNCSRVARGEGISFTDRELPIQTWLTDRPERPSREKIRNRVHDSLRILHVNLGKGKLSESPSPIKKFLTFRQLNISLDFEWLDNTIGMPNMTVNFSYYSRAYPPVSLYPGRLHNAQLILYKLLLEY